VDRVLTELRHEDFANRSYFRSEPDITNVQRDVTSTFSGELLVETQPLPVARSGSRSALLLGCAGVAFTFAGLFILVSTPLPVEPGTMPESSALTWVACAFTLCYFGGRFLENALALLQVFRFESNLFWIHLKGSFTSSNIGIGDGRGGQFYAERRSIQSDTHATVYGARIVSEGNGPNALVVERIIVDSKRDERFDAAFARLLESMQSFKDSTSTLPTIAFENQGVQQILKANMAVTEGMSAASNRGALEAAEGFAPALQQSEGSSPPPPLPSGAPASNVTAETKVCPECGESVKAIARKCRFCGHRFDEDT
jgi:hypothetical protein